MKNVIFILLLLSFPSLAEEKNYGDVIVSKVEGVHDGDTITVTVNKWPAVSGEKIPVRIDGVDTPEINGDCPVEKELAQKAKQFTITFLQTDKRIYLRKMKRDKYFRILADVTVGTKSLSQELIASGLAKPYAGGKKESWCGVTTTSTEIVLSNN